MGEIQTNELIERIQRLSALTARAGWTARLGDSYGGDRDLYQALGYKDNLVFNDFAAQYRRQDIAAAVIDKPVGATWRGDIKLTEGSDDDDTKLETAWNTMQDELNVKSVLMRADKLSCLGRYGAVFLGFDDVQNSAGFPQEVSGGNRKLKYLKPLSEQSCQISAWETDTKNERFGMPKMYDVSFGVQQDTSIAVKVHHTRIIHISLSLLESEVYGVPELESIFNRLTDLEKIVGGSGEMFWRGARPGYTGKVDPEFQLSETEEERMKEQLDEYENNLRRFLVAQGVDYEALETQVSSPKDHVDVQIQMISAAKGIPKRLLTGSERGELASSQDRKSWSDLIDSRREEKVEPVIIRPFVDRLIQYGALPKASEEGYQVEWDNLYNSSESEKADIGKTKSEAIAKYGSNEMNQDIMPQTAYFKLILGMSDEDVKYIKEQQESQMLEEEADFREEQEEFESERGELEQRRADDEARFKQAADSARTPDDIVRNEEDGNA